MDHSSQRSPQRTLERPAPRVATPDAPAPGLDPIGNQERLAGVGLAGPRHPRVDSQGENTLDEANVGDAEMCRELVALTGPQIRRVSAFAEAVGQELSSWGARRRSADLSFDCARLNALARDFLEGWRVAEGGAPPEREVRRYLEHGVRRDALAEISAFELGLSGYYLAVLDITDGDRPTHSYTLELHAGAGISAGMRGSVRRATLRYSNDSGMGWSVEGHLLLVGAGAGAGVDVGGQTGVTPDDGQGHELEVVTPNGPMSAEPTRHYFTPEEFDTCDVFMLEAETAAELQGASGAFSGAAGRSSGFRGVMLQADGHALDFHATSADGASGGPSVSTDQPQGGVQLNAGVSMSMVGGGVFNMGRPVATGVPRPLREAAAGPDPGVAASGRLHFATGSAQLDGDDFSTLQDIIREMQRVDQRFEGALYEVQITGWASRRWRAAHTPEEALAHNRELAERRAATAERNLAALLGDPEVEITTGVRELSITEQHAEVEGPEPIEDNDAEYRAVDIVVTYNPCRASERAPAMRL